MAKVVVVGSYNQDHVWSCDQLPVPGATRLGGYASGPGGKGFNQAMAAARAGADATFITALGVDAAADEARRLATENGITLCAQVLETLPSGAAGIFVDGRGRNVIVVAPGANEALSAGFVQAQAFEGAGVVLAQLEVAAEAVQAALAQGRTIGATTILNPAPANAPTTAALLTLADVLTPNETEFAALLARHAEVELEADSVAGLDDDTLHRHCRTLARDACVVITLGGAGVFVSHTDGRQRGDTRPHYRLPAEAAEVVDTTGAGDAFNGALAAALAKDAKAPFETALRFANRYAARSTEQRGAALAMPRLSPAKS